MILQNVIDLGYLATVAFKVGLEGYTTAWGEWCIKVANIVGAVWLIIAEIERDAPNEPIEILSGSNAVLQGRPRTTVHCAVLTCTVGSPRNKLSQGRNSQPMVADQLWCVRV